MGAIDELVSHEAETIAPVLPMRSRSRQPSHDRQSVSADGTYGDVVPATASRDPRVLLFARFVKRSLDEARDRGMSIDDVEAAIKAANPDTKVGRSTIYRWRRAEVESPQRVQVQAFCVGLGIPVTTASQILGWDGRPPSPEPEPSVDPDLRAVMRKLNDPKVTTEAKKTIRQMLRYLAREE